MFGTASTWAQFTYVRAGAAWRACEREARFESFLVACVCLDVALSDGFAEDALGDGVEEEVLDELELIVGTSDAVFESDVPHAASVEAAATAATAASERDVVRLVRLVIMLRCRRSRHWAHAHAAVTAGRG